jgi:hypothetical protein
MTTIALLERPIATSHNTDKDHRQIFEVELFEAQPPATLCQEALIQNALMTASHVLEDNLCQEMQVMIGNQIHKLVAQTDANPDDATHISLVLAKLLSLQNNFIIANASTLYILLSLPKPELYQTQIERIALFLTKEWFHGLYIDDWVSVDAAFNFESPPSLTYAFSRKLKRHCTPSW